MADDSKCTEAEVAEIRVRVIKKLKCYFTPKNITTKNDQERPITMAQQSSNATTQIASSNEGALQGEVIYSYHDGSVYMGDMKNGKKHGRGTLRTAAIIYGEMYQSSCAEDNAHLVKWHEYIGNWTDDVMHGPGRHVHVCGNGTQNVLFDGIWDNGKQIQPSGEEFFAD